MRNIVILIVGLITVVVIYNFSKESTDHIENYNIAVGHLEKGEFEKAIPYLEKARESKPDEERILRALEDAYYQAGQTDKAKEIQKKLIP